MSLLKRIVVAVMLSLAFFSGSSRQLLGIAAQAGDGKSGDHGDGGGGATCD